MQLNQTPSFFKSPAIDSVALRNAVSSLLKYRMSDMQSIRSATGSSLTSCMSDWIYSSTSISHFILSMLIVCMLMPCLWRWRCASCRLLELARPISMAVQSRPRFTSSAHASPHINHVHIEASTQSHFMLICYTLHKRIRFTIICRIDLFWFCRFIAQTISFHIQYRQVLCKTAVCGLFPHCQNMVYLLVRVTCSLRFPPWQDVSPLLVFLRPVPC